MQYVSENHETGYFCIRIPIMEKFREHDLNRAGDEKLQGGTSKTSFLLWQCSTTIPGIPASKTSFLNWKTYI